MTRLCIGRMLLGGGFCLQVDDICEFCVSIEILIHIHDCVVGFCVWIDYGGFAEYGVVCSGYGLGSEESEWDIVDSGETVEGSIEDILDFVGES